MTWMDPAKLLCSAGTRDALECGLERAAHPDEPASTLRAGCRLEPSMSDDRFSAKRGGNVVLGKGLAFPSICSCSPQSLALATSESSVQVECTK